MTKIDAKYLTKVYKNGAYGLKNCTFSVSSGEFLVIVGASGSGKSTLLKLLAGTDIPSSGELYFEGILAENIPIAKREISMVFQEYVLYPHMTVFDNLATPLRQAGENERSIYERVMEVLRIFGLEPAADVKPKNLSGGEQQRVALAKALLKRSKILLLDEPMSNVDEKSRWEYCSTLKQMKQMLPDSTFIYVTHNTREAMFLADRIAVMHDGAILQVAPKDLLIKYPEYLEVVEIMGYVGKTLDAEFDGEGFSTDEDVLDLMLPQIDRSAITTGNRSIVVQSAIDDESLYLFDKEGRSLSLSMTEFRLCGHINNNTLEFAGQTIELTDEYLSRLLRKASDVSVGIRIDMLSKTPFTDSIPLTFEVVENFGDHVVLRTQDKSFIYCKKTALKSGERIRLYYQTDNLIIYDGDQRLTCHYPLHRRVGIRVIDGKSGRVEILGKRIKLNRQLSENVRYVRITDSGFELSYVKGKYSLPPLIGCLDEEFINRRKLSHIAVKGIDGYISLMSEEDISCFGKKRVWLNLIPEGLQFEENN